MSSVFMRTLSPAVPFRIFAYFNYRNSSSIHFSPHSYLSLCLLPNLFFSAIPLPTIMFTLTLISRPLPHSITLFSFPMFTAYPLLARFDHPLSFPYLHPHSSTTPFYYSLFHNSLPFPIFTLISATFRFLRPSPICLCPCHLPSRGMLTHWHVSDMTLQATWRGPDVLAFSTTHFLRTPKWLASLFLFLMISFNREH